MAIYFPYFIGNKASRSELIQRIVVETIIASKVPDGKRAWSKVFELKHSSSVVQIGRMLAQKRKLNVELAEIVCVLHDIYVNDTGDGTDHGARGAVLAEKILHRTRRFKNSEIKIISNAIRHHSDKHLVSKDSYVELIKDADVFDCGLYEGMHDAYLYVKPLEICRTYFDRIKKIRKELSLPKDAQWDSLKYLTLKK